MGAITTPINTIDNVSGASTASSLHSTPPAPHRPIPQDTAVLSVQAIQFGDTNALAGHSFAPTPPGAASTTPAAASSSRATSATSPSRESTPQQQAAQQTPDPIRALYSNQTKAPPVFSVLA
jgi:hypothetical protein